MVGVRVVLLWCGFEDGAVMVWVCVDEPWCGSINGWLITCTSSS